MAAEYTCAVCKRTLPKVSDGSWSDEDALAELKESFGAGDHGPLAVLCDDCYVAFMADFKDKH